MANRVFISFRFSDGSWYKDKLVERFDESNEVINFSENEDRTNLSEKSIRNYLYGKLKNTSVTIVLLTPEAIEHKKDSYGRYDDWMHDEIRYSLENRDNNNPNGLIAVYTVEAKQLLMNRTTCGGCEKACTLSSIIDFDNLVRPNMMNVKPEYKKNKCEGVYDSNWDLYCSLVSWEEFLDNYAVYIQIADQKRKKINKYKLKKNLNM